jgi:hypothetical protein
MQETCISKLPRFQPIDRTQIFLRTTDVESFIAEDHPVRAIWIFLERLDLSKFSEEQRAVEGSDLRSQVLLRRGKSATFPCPNHRRR